ncbi:MAG TPA: response regulator [Candidatus Deferrimicrobium sp.]|nr:response regulator [Candidatus Deferrimicrobium sp.]
MLNCPSTSHLRPILLIDDSAQDRESMIRALHKLQITNPIISYDDGEEALNCLFRRGEYEGMSEAAYPAFILLDLNMPGIDGIQVLETIKVDSRLKKIPVVVLTTSSTQEDIDRCYSLGANSYIRKPFGVAGLDSIVDLLKRYWLDCAALPEIAG